MSYDLWELKWSFEPPPHTHTQRPIRRLLGGASFTQEQMPLAGQVRKKRDSFEGIWNAHTEKGNGGRCGCNLLKHKPRQVELEAEISLDKRLSFRS